MLPKGPESPNRSMFLPNVAAFRGFTLQNVEVIRHCETLLVEPMGFESTSNMETKEFCGAARPSKELKRKGGNP